MSEDGFAPKPGDIVLHRYLGRGEYGPKICAFTHSPYTHVELYVGEGMSISAEMAGVSCIEYDRGGGAFIDVCRHQDVSAEQIQVAVNWSKSMLDSDYDVDHLSNFPYLAPHTAMQLAQNSEFICSELVSLAYERAGVEITDDDRPASLHAPADIAHCDALDYVVSLHEGERIADAALNEWHHRQPSIDPWIELEVRAEALSSPRARRLYHYYRDMAKRGRARCE